MAAPMCTCLSYTRASLLSMRDVASRLDRCTRKVLFSSEICRTKYVRLTSTFGNDEDPHCPSVSLPPPPPPPSSLPSVPSSPGIRLVTWNIHSLRNKYHAVADTVLADSIDLLECHNRILASVFNGRRRPPLCPSGLFHHRLPSIDLAAEWMADGVEESSSFTVTPFVSEGFLS